MEGVRKGGGWIPALFDHLARRRSDQEGRRLAMHMAELGLEVLTVSVPLEDAVDEIAARLATGRLKVLSSLGQFLAAMRRVRRNDKGEIVCENDHLMRCAALLTVHGVDVAITENRAASDATGYDPAAYQGRRNVTGY